MQKLTKNQEVYCQSRTSGQSISQSYLIAYPNSSKYTKNTLYNVSSTLEHNPKITQRISELQRPLDNYLEQNRILIIQKAIDTALGKNPDEKVNVSVLNKLIDKLIPDIKESKVDANHRFNVTIESAIAELDD